MSRELTPRNFWPLELGALGLCQEVTVAGVA
jgi:hypothetical protein